MFYEKLMWFKSKYGDKPKFKEFTENELDECNNFIDSFHYDTIKYRMENRQMVGICLSIGKIEAVNTNKQTIKASLELKLRVNSEELLKLNTKDFKYDYNLLRIKKDLEPKFIIMNALDESLKYKYIDTQNIKKGVIDYNYHYICTLFDEVDVHNFPFDWQSFRVIVLLSDTEKYKSFGYLDDKKYMDDGNNLANKIYNNNTFIPDWNIYGLNGGTCTSEIERSCMGVEILTESNNTGTRMSFNGKNGDYFNKRIFSVTFWLQRKPFYVISTIWMVNFIIMLIGLISFQIPEEDLNDRLQYDAMLLLTLVAQKFSFQESVPKVAYLTMFDKKLLYNFLNILILMIIHGYEFMEVLGIWKQVLYISLVLFGEIVFFIYGYFSTKQTYYKKKIPIKLNSDDDSLEAGIDYANFG